MSHLDSIMSLDTTNMKDKKKMFVLLIASAFVMLLSYIIKPEIAGYFSDFFTSAIPLTSAVLSALLVVKFKVKSSQGKMLLMFTVFASFWAIAETWWSVYRIIYNIEPFPSYADFFWLVGYFFLGIFLVQYLKPFRKIIPRKVQLFGIAIVIAFLIPSLIETYYVKADPDYFKFAIALSYPIADAVILLPTVIGLIASYNNKSNRFLILLLSATLCNIIADTIYLATYDSYNDGNPVDIGWISSYILLVFAVRNYKPLTDSDVHISHADLDKNKITRNIKTETILKFVIPFTIISILIITGIVMMNQYLQNPAKNDFEDTYIFMPVIGIISTITLILNRNFSKLVKMRSKELESDKEKLEQLVAEKSQEMIKKERLSVIGELASRLAHDFRNPLSIIKNGTELIKIKLGDNIDDKTKNQLQIMSRAISRMTTQIDEVMNFVKIRSLILEESSLLEIIKYTVSTISIPQNIKIIIPENDIKIVCDANMMEVVLGNMITNAVQAINNKDGSIIISLSDEKENVSINIKDTGSGIPQEVLPKIFDPLFTTKQSGTGLGLVSCKNIIEQYGGKIQVTSEKEKGTTFTILIPKVVH